MSILNNLAAFPTTTSNHQVQEQSHAGRDHGLARLSTGALQKLMHYLTVEETACVMVSSPQFMQHIKPVFLGEKGWVRQSVFKQRALPGAWLYELPVQMRELWYLPISQIIFQSRLLGEEQRRPLITLLNTCKSQMDLETIREGLPGLTACRSRALADSQLEVYESLTWNLSFADPETFHSSVASINDLYPYRALIMRSVTDQQISRAVNFVPSCQTVERVRNGNSYAWRSLQKSRAKMSNTVFTDDGAYTNWLKADAFIAKSAQQRTPVTITWLEEMHKTISENQHNHGHPAGYYRQPNIQSFVCSTKRCYIDGKYVIGETTTFITWLTNKLELHDCEQQDPLHIPRIVLTAAQSFQWLVSIHPFPDGNGRTCSLVMDYVLQRYGILPPHLKHREVAVFGDDCPNVDAIHAFNLVWEGIENSYRTLADVLDILAHEKENCYEPA
jgi:hypothetical protein